MTVRTEDFATLLELSFQEETPERGDIVTGTVLTIDQQGLLVDVGMKSDGIVPWSDIDKMGKQVDFEVGEEVHVMIGREDSEGNLQVSISQARQLTDWKLAEDLMASQDVWQGDIVDANKGGVIVGFGYLRGFVPASHVVGLPRDLQEDERRFQLKRMIGRTIGCKVIEVNQKRRRLVLSEREAQREQREQRREDLLEELNEGDTVRGMISGMRDFGAFVDLGGADGLIHISELAWQRVNHPREIVKPGEHIDVYVLRLDRENKRIELSLKRLQPNPWAEVEERYYVGQLLNGSVNRTTDYGIFVTLEPGIEGLVHTNHVPAGVHLNDVQESSELLLRVISIEADSQRIGLSMSEVTDDEWADWQSQQADPSPELETSLE